MTDAQGSPPRDSCSLPRQLARTRRFTLGVPGRFTLTPDGGTALFLRGRAGDDRAACLWALDLDSGTERVLADPRALPGGPGAGIEAYATDRAAALAAFPLAGSLWAVDVAAGRVRRLPAPGPVTDPRPSPDGRTIAYVRAGALRVIGADGTGDRAVAAPESPDAGYGTGVHTGATAADGGSRGYWWAPDGGRLLVARAGWAGVALWHLADPAEPAAAPRSVRYAAAGTANADVTLWLANLDGARTEVRWDRREFEYVVGAGWDVHGPYAVVQSRDQRTVRFLAVDPAGTGTGPAIPGGAGAATTVLAERRDDRWVELVPGLPARTGSGAVLWHADRRGTRYLTVDGRAVTPPGLQVRAVLAVCGDQAHAKDEEHAKDEAGDEDEVLFAASEDPAETHLWSYGAAAGLRRLTEAPAVHAGVRRGGSLVRITRDGERPGGRAEVLRAGGPAVLVASSAERPVLGVRATRLVLGPRGLRAALHLPSWYGPDGGPLPVLLDPYGGAGRQRVTAELDWRVLVSQWFAEQGFAVLVADGRGTPGRGPEWERAVHGDLFGPALADQVAALHEAARRHPALDLGRVGIRGWSFGGSLAAVAVLRRPDVFHAAVAGAPVTDQRLYDAHWRERVLGHPDANPRRYEDSSLIRLAPRLIRPLLLVHGLADAKAHPAHTLRLSGALLAAGRPHDVLLLPGAGHQAIGTAQATESLLRHQADFLRRHLAGRRPATRCAPAPGASG